MLIFVHGDKPQQWFPHVFFCLCGLFKMISSGVSFDFKICLEKPILLSYTFFDPILLSCTFFDPPSRKHVERVGLLFF